MTPSDHARAIIEEFERNGETSAARLLMLTRITEAISTTPEVKALQWKEPSPRTNGCWVAESAIGNFSVGFDDGWHACLEDGLSWDWEPEDDPRSYGGPYAAQAACQQHLSSVILSALLTAGEPA